MPRAKVTSKGQITLPKAVRDRLGLQTGDTVDFGEETGGYVIRKHVGIAPFRGYRGFLNHLEGRNPDTLLDDMRGS